MTHDGWTIIGCLEHHLMWLVFKAYYCRLINHRQCSPTRWSRSVEHLWEQTRRLEGFILKLGLTILLSHGCYVLYVNLWWRDNWSYRKDGLETDGKKYEIVAEFECSYHKSALLRWSWENISNLGWPILHF